MLNKEICKKCINDYGTGRFDKYDQKYWKEGFVHCPYLYTLNIENKPPEYCIYILEHLMKEEVDVK